MFYCKYPQVKTHFFFLSLKVRFLLLSVFHAGMRLQHNETEVSKSDCRMSWECAHLWKVLKQEEMADIPGTTVVLLLLLPTGSKTLNTYSLYKQLLQIVRAVPGSDGNVK